MKIRIESDVSECGRFDSACFSEEVRPLLAHLVKLGVEPKFRHSNLKLFPKFISREQLFSDSVWRVRASHMSYLSSVGSLSVDAHQVSSPSELTSTKKFMKRSLEKIALSIQNDSIP